MPAIAKDGFRELPAWLGMAGTSAHCSWHSELEIERHAEISALTLLINRSATDRLSDAPRSIWRQVL